MQPKIEGSALVLTRFHVGGVEIDPEAAVVDIEGRREGFFTWLLTLTGFDPTTRLVVTRRDISLQVGGLDGEFTGMVPCTAVASVHAGYSRSLGHLILGGLLLACAAILGGFSSQEVRGSSGFGIMAGGAVLSAVVALGLVIVYFTEKKMAIFVESSGGAIIGMVFKPSVIEGVDVDIERVRNVVVVIREVVLAGRVGTMTSAVAQSV